MRLIPYAELKPRKGIRWTRTHLRRKIKDGSFPAPVQLGEDTIAWVEEEIDAWIADRAAAREKASA